MPQAPWSSCLLQSICCWALADDNGSKVDGIEGLGGLEQKEVVVMDTDTNAKGEADETA